ncbi:hypothetical protein [Natrinema salaciae]|uniref:Uncharacterized protein n=1 Tax=Natrinema salaciae TaxID=1186196 RepID=A0A1H9ID03_9EURY|nr:hypothetical protein [Natrinema salaciae]SEQ72459.1 hypothetical protein SAMN04489841_2191 [Natrinema salaciae]
MGSIDDDGGSPSRSPRRRIAVSFVLLTLCAPLLAGVAFLAGPAVAGAAVGLVVLVGLLIALSRRRTAATDPGRETDGRSTVWNAIPPWQYDGRHAETGGLTRGEQERAIRDVRERADDLSEDPTRK